MTNLLFTSIGRRGYIADYFRSAAPEEELRIIGTSCYPETVGFCACDRSYIVPPVIEEGYLGAIMDICERESIDAMFSFLDLDVVELSKHRQRFVEGGFHPFFPEHSVCEMFFDKMKTAAFLTDHGMVSPKTYSDLAAFESDLEAGRISLPVVVKGRRGFASIGLEVCRTLESLQHHWQATKDAIIQEFCEGPEYNLDLFHDLEGNYLVGNIKRKLAMRSGETDQAVTIDDAELQAFCDQFGKSFRGAGPCDVDFVRTEAGCLVIDVNPRFGGGYPTSHVAGANYPQLAMSILRGEDPDPQAGKAKAGVLSMKKIEIVGVDHEELLSGARKAGAADDLAS